MKIREVIKQIPSPNLEAAAESRRRWNSIAKPVKSLGNLERAVEKISALTGDPSYSIDKRAVLVLCASNGVVAQKVSSAGRDVTIILARYMLENQASVCRMAEAVNAQVKVVDMGMDETIDHPALIQRCIAMGTGDISQGPAMSRAQAEQAIEAGIDLVREAKEQGYKILATGEMGIGNTTTSSAVCTLLLGEDLSAMVGRGAGLTDEALVHKIKMIQQAIEVNQPDPEDALDVLAKVGGLDIAGLAGVFLGGAYYRIPILVDGLISATAALVARHLAPASFQAMLASHVSAEPASRRVLNELGLHPLIDAGMCLGEGTGAVAALPLLDLAYSVYHEVSSLSDMNIESYNPEELLGEQA